MSRSFYVDSLIIKDTVRPGPAEHPGQDFLIPISMHSPSVMTVTAPVCPSRKSGTFCVCPLCVTSHIHSSRSGIPMLKSQFPGAEAQYCQRIAQQSPALAHPGHTPVCTPTFSVTDPRRYHCLSIGKPPVCIRFSLQLGELYKAYLICYLTHFMTHFQPSQTNVMATVLRTCAQADSLFHLHSDGVYTCLSTSKKLNV